ncbi:hypothetical protein AKJ09_09828 [Labilithrix luteola]|uniref:Uncharacterized protein n=1 Tax=Labilithrix luteola TaxID=1391654 RepID=A0A0K1QCK9_9BACT|nr:hypothetical protein AKJ09_09828 [Labilithrix luteola]
MSGFRVGDSCDTPGCQGSFENERDCSCHIRPPCDGCVEPLLSCSECGRDPNDEATSCA